MLPVTQAYLAAIRAPVRTDRVRGELVLPSGTKIALTSADLMSGTLTIDDQCVTGEELTLGCCYLGQAAFSIKTALDRYTLYGAVVTLYYDIRLADGSWYTVPLGVYNIAEAERTGSTVAIKAYDNAVLLDKAFDGEALQGTPYEILCQIAKRCGLTVGQTEAELNAFCNSDESFQLVQADGCDTYRECVRAVAQVLACFATVDRTGALVLRKFAATPCATLAPADRCKTTVADYRCFYDSLAVDTDSEKYTAETDPPGNGLQMTIDDAPLLNKGLPARCKALVNVMFAQLKPLRYVPATITLPGDPALECGDLLALQAVGTNAETVNTLVTHRVWKYHGRQTVRGAGRNPRLAAAAQKSSAAVRRLQTQTEQNRLIFYSFTNPAALKISESVQYATLARILFVTVADTSAMLLAQLLLSASPTAADAPLVLTVQYYLNDTLLADYSPCQTLAAGQHTLALFYPFASLPAGSANTLELRATVQGGQVSVAAGGVRATVTGQGMAGGEVWDGTLTAEEVLPPMRYPAAPFTLVDKVSETLQAETQAPLAAGPTETLPRMRWQEPVFVLAPLTLELGRSVVVQAQTVGVNYPPQYDAHCILAGADGFAVRTEYRYTGTEQAVDAGRLTTMLLRTEELATVTEIEVE